MQLMDIALLGLFFFEGTINSERYLQLIIDPFLDELTYAERLSVYFQQDSATAHTAGRSIRELRRIFGTRLISNNLWPPRSPDLTPCDFYLWGTLKSRVYRKNPHSINELKDYIRQEIEAISGVELQNVVHSFIRRCQLCVAANGGHFQHRL